MEPQKNNESTKTNAAANSDEISKKSSSHSSLKEHPLEEIDMNEHDAGTEKLVNVEKPGAANEPKEQ